MLKLIEVLRLVEGSVIECSKNLDDSSILRSKIELEVYMGILNSREFNLKYNHWDKDTADDYLKSIDEVESNIDRFHYENTRDEWNEGVIDFIVEFNGGEIKINALEDFNLYELDNVTKRDLAMIINFKYIEIL